mmetsp:Transcript_80035/g.201372  ORF Transcript_80035/g.201372 Transcript_80035/m.201372 type:complete len:83 (+) Transcript_80035:61-309(+)
MRCCMRMESNAFLYFMHESSYWLFHDAGVRLPTYYERLDLHTDSNCEAPASSRAEHPTRAFVCRKAAMKTSLCSPRTSEKIS